VFPFFSANAQPSSPSDLQSLNTLIPNSFTPKKSYLAHNPQKQKPTSPPMDAKLKKADKEKTIFTGADLYPVMQSILLRENRMRRAIEHFWVASMDNGYKLLNVELINIGAANRVAVQPPEVFRLPIYKVAARVMLVHTPRRFGRGRHPSGLLQPSEEDKDFTDRMIKVGKLLRINVADHLIITETGHYSFAAQGLMMELAKSGAYEVTKKESEETKKWKEELLLKKGEDKAKREMALWMLGRNMPVSDIVEATKLRKSSVEKLRKELKGK
jgi:DNA repair protein RadC